MKEKNENNVGLAPRWIKVLVSLVTTVFLLVIVSSSVYLIILIALEPDRLTNLFYDMLRSHFLAIAGIPLATIIALLVVCIFGAQFGNMGFELWQIKFKGAAGPVVLWVFSFLAISLAIYILSGCGIVDEDKHRSAMPTKSLHHNEESVAATSP